MRPGFNGIFSKLFWLVGLTDYPLLRYWDIEETPQNKDKETNLGTTGAAEAV